MLVVLIRCFFSNQEKKCIQLTAGSWWKGKYTFKLFLVNVFNILLSLRANKNFRIATTRIELGDLTKILKMPLAWALTVTSSSVLQFKCCCKRFIFCWWSMLINFYELFFTFNHNRESICSYSNKGDWVHSPITQNIKAQKKKKIWLVNEVKICVSIAL